jgi:hypothetical protein
MDLSGIISVAGMGGLYKVIAQTKNGLLVESISDGKRVPVYSTSKVSALEDISIYGQSDDIPLKDVFRSIRDSKSGIAVPSTKDSNNQMKDAFAAFVPSFDEDRVYASDMKKVFVWYSILNDKGLLVEKEVSDENTADEASEKPKAEKAAAKPKAKEVTKTASPKASSKAMAKTPTVRKTGG